MPKGQVALISGSSKGLGKELSSLLSKRGMKVITMGFESNSDVDIRCNLLEPKNLQIALKNYFQGGVQIDLLVCNAGTGKTPSIKLSDSELKHYFMEKNYFTALNLIEAAIPYMKTQSSSVVGISSIVALKEIPGAPTAYRVAKQELNRLFRIKAKEFAAQGIRFNVISPGNILFEGSRWEEILTENPRRVRELLDNEVPLKRFIGSEEIADAIIYLSSDSGKNITGANLVIDGGQSLD
jgi:NAD(P)-dependent dehydrogenase (short-subunit alcohol dehydrogenase family)